MKTNPRLPILLLLLVFILTSCGPIRIQPLSTPTPPPPSATPRPATQTPRPSDTAQPSPSPSATPSPSPTTTPVVYSPLLLPKGPILIYTGSESAMRVIWQWGQDTLFRVEWGTDERYDMGSADIAAYDEENQLYAYEFSGLQPDTRYTYRIILDENAAGGSFRTAPAPGEETLKFVSYGDTRTNPDFHDAVAAQVVQLYQNDPLYQTINLFVGDFVTRGDLEDDWKFELFDPPWTYVHALLANTAFLPAMGNHEGGGQLFLRYFPLPFVKARYGSFDYGPAHIVLVDQYVPFGPGSNQYAWMEADLKTSAKKWKFVVLHEPGWSAAGGHDNNVVTQSLQPLFEQTGVSVVFAGHNHYYARAEVGGVTHLTIGTGGAPLYTPLNGMPRVVTTYQGTGYAKFEIDGSTLKGWFIAADGTEMDSFTVER